MKTLNFFAVLSALFIISSCRTEPQAPLTDNTGNTEHYSSLAEFYEANTVPSVTYSMNAGSPYSFTSAQGTHVSIPANAFVSMTGAPVSGTVKIEFKDVYKKSDMVLTNLSTTYYGVTPMASAGMFFIKATVNESVVKIATGQHITINQPINTPAPDPGMIPMVMAVDSGPRFWAPSLLDTLLWSATDYIFSLYRFNSPEDSGTWCNSDNPTYFSAYPNTTLTMQTTDVDTIPPDVFLVFTGINSMIHVYRDYLNLQHFPYNYAPVGLPCTVVCVGVRNNKLYSSFTPITITANQTVNFSMTETTADAFKTHLNSLN